MHTTAGRTRLTTGRIRVPVARQRGLARRIGWPAVESLAREESAEKAEGQADREVAAFRVHGVNSMVTKRCVNSIAAKTRKPGFELIRSRAVTVVRWTVRLGRAAKAWSRNGVLASRHVSVYAPQPGHGRDSTACRSYSEGWLPRFHRSPHVAHVTVQLVALPTSHRPLSRTPSVRADRQ